MHWSLVVLLVIGGAMGLLHLLNRPLKHRTRLDGLERFLASAVADLDTGSVITLREDRTRRTIQFVLNKKTVKYQLKLHVPWHPHTADLPARVLDALEHAGLVPATKRWAPNRDRLLVLRGDEPSLVAQAVPVATVALRALGADDESPVTVWSVGGVDPRALERETRRMLEHRNPLVRAWARRRLREPRK